jgi:hypothetical protein
MCAVPILICSHWAARGTNMVPGLVAPLSPREISQLRQLQQGKSQPDPTGFKRFIMLGLVEERPGGFAIAELGWLRLHAELKAESANRGRPPLFGR